MTRITLAWIFATMVCAADAQVAAPRTEIEATASRETLSKGLPAWTSHQLLIEHHQADRQVLYGGWRDTSRFGLRDDEIHGGAYLPLGSALLWQIEAGVSETHRVLARHYGQLTANFQLAPGWGIYCGGRRSSYDAGNTSVFNLGAERYLGNDRFAYTLFAGGPDGAATVSSHRLQWTRHYGDRRWVGVSLAEGREAERIGSGTFVTTRVASLALAGQHEFARAWSLVWEAGRQNQGDLYTRSGVRLGLRHEF